MLMADWLGEPERSPRPPSHSLGKGPTSKGRGREGDEEGEKEGQGIASSFLTSGYRPEMCQESSFLRQCVN